MIQNLFLFVQDEVEGGERFEVSEHEGQRDESNCAIVRVSAFELVQNNYAICCAKPGGHFCVSCKRPRSLVRG